METFYDTHAHLTFPDFSDEIPALLERAQAAGITRVITIGTDLVSSREAVAPVSYTHLTLPTKA